MYRTADWRRHQDERRIRHWQHVFLNVFDIPFRNEPQYWYFDEQCGSWVYHEAGRFRKHTQSCDKHLGCIIDRYCRRYRNFRGRWQRYWRRHETTGQVSIRGRQC